MDEETKQLIKNAQLEILRKIENARRARPLLSTLDFKREIEKLRQEVLES